MGRLLNPGDQNHRNFKGMELSKKVQLGFAREDLVEQNEIRPPTAQFDAGFPAIRRKAGDAQPLNAIHDEFKESSHRFNIFDNQDLKRRCRLRWLRLER